MEGIYRISATFYSSRGKDRPTDKGRKDKRDSRDRERDRERERRLREEREAAREKEREEALARCQERQRERERLKELEKKENERRGRDRGRRDERVVDDRLSNTSRRHSPADRRGHSVDARKSVRNTPDRHLDRVDVHQREYGRIRDDRRFVFNMLAEFNIFFNFVSEWKRNPLEVLMIEARNADIWNLTIILILREKNEFH